MLVSRSAAEVPDLLSALEAARTRGLHAAGYLAYEAGKGLAPAWRGAADAKAAGGAPLGWFGLFERVERIAADAVPARLPDPDAARSEEHTSELQSLMRSPYAGYRLKKK